MRGSLETPVRPSGGASVGVLTGALLALLISGGLVAERASRGDVRVALVVNGLMMAGALLALRVTEAEGEGVPRFAHATGAAAGVLAVHAALHVGWLAGPSWLVERPAQLVNDVIAVGVTVGLVWACAEGIRAGRLVVAFVAMTLYRLTSPMWHLDAAPHGWLITVQELVVAQLVAVAAGLIAYEAATRDRA